MKVGVDIHEIGLYTSMRYYIFVITKVWYETDKLPTPKVHKTKFWICTNLDGCLIL